MYATSAATIQIAFTLGERAFRAGTSYHTHVNDRIGAAVRRDVINGRTVNNMESTLTVDWQRRLEIEATIIDYWHNVDHHWGRDAHLFYTEDASFSTSERTRTGRAAIAQFYSGRRDRGARVARHVISNLRVTLQGDAAAATESILLLFASDGEPVLPSAPPIMIADVRESFRRGADGRWLCASRAIIALFKGGAPTTS